MMMHVYIIPEKRSNGYCFGGPVPVEFGNVDWMDAPPDDISVNQVKGWLQQKTYFERAEPGTRFLVLCDIPEMTFQMVR